MASSSTPHLVNLEEDDDEGFDWEAAVREIDVACAQTTTNSDSNTRISCISTSNGSNLRETHKTFVPEKGNSFSCSSRQSTLDRFITGVVSNSNGLQRGKEENCGNEFRKNGNNSYSYIGKDEYEVRDAEGSVSFVKIELEAAKTWVYPVNIPRRDYQFNIARTALFSNTLVALPTGLGKTLIAAVVMYNYFRWFPEGKIVFAAPSRPLVLQQIEACHKVVGIPQEWTIDLTGQTSPTKRAFYWKSKRVFFVTPQVLEKDIYSGSCVAKHLVCLVIDEAHRATGNYSYCVIVRELKAVPVELRILALTATPGSKQQTIQHIIDNLQISRLEYRSESDPDVVPYVHDRKVELIEVAMGNDAVEVNNLILEVVRPYIARLGAIGVLPSRDFQMLSPCDLLNSRDKFRQAPPENLPQMKYGEVEGYFGVLITLYHIRKLLSSHGIKPAFEMLQEKLQQGSFARLMSRNEVLLKAKLLMQQNISHGAPSPKLSKMLEVLSDHFKMKNPHNSRVIIFSNFRGSVRDIMIALKNIGEFVKATEFIGQSSGKASKGQSQKVQQAVLEKFRAGGYNVIVATSIGEEGLDIMEVDLVICFDANISPLRMIQRMGRTGRKHEGRVVVLACEGSELKGYMRKQANSKAIRKHMQNGGTNSFQFHSSPRMIPHILKPDVQFVELSIEQFVPRAKKVNDDCLIDSPAYKTKLTDAENGLIAKYFCPSEENPWRPSLIAFPHFQAFPSRVRTVVHSFRTGMLIDAMQCLQGLSFLEDTKACPAQDRTSPEPCSKSEVAEQCNVVMKELRRPMNFPEEDCREVSNTKCKPMENISEGEPYLQDSQQKILAHSFLFNCEFVTLDDLGRVMVSSLPKFPLKEVPISKCNNVSKTASPHHLEEAYVNLDASTKSSETKNEQVKDASASQVRSQEDNKDFSCQSNNFLNVSQEQTLDRQSLQTPISKHRGGENICNSPQDRTPAPFDEDSNDESREFDLSPRLTNFLECGIVPESPVNISERPPIREDEFNVPDHVSTPGVHSQLVVKSPEPSEGGVDFCGHEMNDQSSLINEIQISAATVNKNAKFTSSTVEKAQSPVINSSDTSYSKDWNLNSGEKSVCVKQTRKFRRLCKLGDLCSNKLEDLKEQINGLRDLCRNKPEDLKEQINGPSINFTNSCTSADHVRIHHGRGKKKKVYDAGVFVEEEAEVSSVAMVSADEEDELDNNSYDDSFIDDRLNPTAASTQAEEGAIDMMAVYRRSLLSQSPLERVPNIGADSAPSSEVPRNESTSTSRTESHFVHKSQNGLESTARNAASSRLNYNLEFSDPMPSGRASFAEEDGSKIEHRKRKFHQASYLPVYNLEKEFTFQSMTSGKNTIQEDDKFPGNEDIFDEDQFYNAIDLDAVEEQATKLLRYKSECSTQKQVLSSEPVHQNPAVLGSPSFDLGI